MERTGRAIMQSDAARVIDAGTQQYMERLGLLDDDLRALGHFQGWIAVQISAAGCR
jgi:hypothetical protein